jgi:hypothetical protein
VRKFGSPPLFVLGRNFGPGRPTLLYGLNGRSLHRTTKTRPMYIAGGMVQEPGFPIQQVAECFGASKYEQNVKARLFQVERNEEIETTYTRSAGVGVCHVSEYLARVHGHMLLLSEGGRYSGAGVQR